MTPISVKWPVLATAAAVLLATGAGAGWTAQGWRKDAEIAGIEKARAEDKASQADNALADLTAASSKVKAAADGAQIDIDALGAKLDAIHKDFRNAKPPALPADCRLDPIRLRKLTNTASAVNEAAAGLRISPALQTAPGAGDR